MIKDLPKLNPAGQSPWIPHKPGDPMPLHEGVHVVPLLRRELDGTTNFSLVSYEAGHWTWSKATCGEDVGKEIVAYSICLDERTDLPLQIDGFSEWAWHWPETSLRPMAEGKVITLRANNGNFDYSSVGLPQTAGELDWSNVYAYCVQDGTGADSKDEELLTGDRPELPEGVEPW